jgi:hypothetical protein
MHFTVRPWAQVSDSASFKRLKIAQVQSIRELPVSIGIISCWLLVVCHSLPRDEARGERTTLHDVCGWFSTNPFDSERVRKLIARFDFESPSHPHTRSRERNWETVHIPQQTRGRSRRLRRRKLGKSTKFWDDIILLRMSLDATMRPMSA